MSQIKQIKARSIIDSRGWPTVEAEVVLGSHLVGRASVPSGASTGTYEAVELRDGDKKQFLGRGVQKAVDHIQKILSPYFLGFESGRQRELDKELIAKDGTKDKSKLGANALLAVSMAYARASALDQGIPLYRWLAQGIGQKGNLLPIPMMNVINGGRHADNNIDIQEFMIVPAGSNFRHSLQMGVEVFQHLKKELQAQNLSTAVGDEGGFAPRVSSIRQILEILVQSIQKAGYEPGRQIALALDAASSEFFVSGEYRLRTEEGVKRTPQEVSDYYRRLQREFPIVSIEDGLSEEDWAGWATMTRQIGKSIQLVGDDLFVTSPERLQEGIEKKVANSILIKPNQIGTVTETLETIRLAKEAGYTTVMSHRSGETEDTFIADLAVGSSAGQIKTGGLSRSERLAKYNQLLRIEEELGADARFDRTPLFHDAP